MKLHFIYRADMTNVGDWWSAPFRYFKFDNYIVHDLYDEIYDFNLNDIFIIGGGGLGRNNFIKYFKTKDYLKCKNVIFWGVGVDSVVSINNIISIPNEYMLYGDYFSQFTDVGIRVFSNNQKFKYGHKCDCKY